MKFHRAKLFGPLAGPTTLTSGQADEIRRYVCLPSLYPSLWTGLSTASPKLGHCVCCASNSGSGSCQSWSCPQVCCPEHCWQPCAKHSDRKCAASHFPHEFEESHLSDLSPARQCLTAASSASVKEQYCSCLHATVSECPPMKLNPRQACSGTATSCLSADVLSFLSSTRTRKKHKSDCHMNRMFSPALITTHTHGIAWMLHEHWLRSCNALFLIESQVLYDVLGSPMVLV